MLEASCLTRRLQALCRYQDGYTSSGWISALALVRELIFALILESLSEINRWESNRA